MTNLPITRLIVFKHGVGYFERSGPFSGERLALSFPREAMDDVLKSLVALDLGAGQVLGVDFETPEDRAARLARGSIHLSEHQSLLDLLRDLRGRVVRLALNEGKKSDQSLEGLVVGVDYEPEQPLRRAMVSLYLPATRQVRTVSLDAVKGVDLLDDGAADDLAYFLRAAQSEEQRRSATLRLSPGEHDLLVGYIAPAPAWRVSYRLLYEEGESVGGQEGATGLPPAASTASDPAPALGAAGLPPAFCLLQGWGLFDNQLEEDLEGVTLTLMAGMPVSFRYRLYEPHTPERPLVQDEERTVEAPIFYASAPAAAPMMAAEVFGGAGFADAPAPVMARQMSKRVRGADLEASVSAAASGDERGALFAYNVEHPVSVARGQSAMVPIVSRRLPARRELLYNSAKLPKHPVASLRLNNETGLTLERGPVTVLAEGDYAGEAVLPFTRTGGELIVPYAVELGLSVDEEQRNERQLHAVRLRGDYAIFEEYELTNRSYHLSSTLDRAAEVTVEHNRLGGYDLSDTRAPDEESAGFARWRVNCAPQARTVFVVSERRLASRREQVRSLTGDLLRRLLKNRMLDQATVEALEGVLALFRQADEAQRRLRTLEQEREAIYKQQRQIQGNVQPLGREGDEGALRQRYVASLSQLEDRLGAIATEEEQARQESARLEQQATEQLKQMAQG